MPASSVPAWVPNILYIFASILFIVGLKGLTRPRTAVRGNLTGSMGMLVAVIAVLLSAGLDYTWIAVGIGIGGAIGVALAVTIQMTAMPQLVALFNGFGGLASVLVAGAELHSKLMGKADDTTFTEHLAQAFPDLEPVTFAVSTGLAGLIGAVTFTGSLIAFAKLQEFKAFKKPFSFPGMQLFNILLVLGTIGIIIIMTVSPVGQAFWLWAMILLALILGITLTSPIGGADMPVVVALLNSYSGLAASATGFVVGNNVLIIAGSLVGASGLILTKIMCVAMNRSLLNVLFGSLGPTADGPTADEIYEGKIKATSADEVAMMLEMARRVVIVPGYGLAVAQAQHQVRDLTNLLEERDITVEFGIHPVAGRMPGHMNVLLAEAQIPYDKLIEMDSINPSFSQTDVTIVIGANDVVNPEARENPDSPIAGMPILDVDKSTSVVVIKRSLSPGFAGIPNPLFAMDNTLMFFGDGKQALLDLIAAVKEN